MNRIQFSNFVKGLAAPGASVEELHSSEVKEALNNIGFPVATEPWHVKYLGKRTMGPRREALEDLWGVQKVEAYYEFARVQKALYLTQGVPLMATEEGNQLVPLLRAGFEFISYGYGAIKPSKFLAYLNGAISNGRRFMETRSLEGLVTMTIKPEDEPERQVVVLGPPPQFYIALSDAIANDW